MKKVLFTLAALFAFGFAYAQTDAPVMQFCDAEGNQLDDTRRLPKQGSNAVILFGAGGSAAQTRVDDAEWQFEIRKQKGNPLLVFSKPKFAWKKTRGYCAAGKAQSGFMSYDSPTSISLKCGKGVSEVTHKIKVQLTK